MIWNINDKQGTEMGIHTDRILIIFTIESENNHSKFLSWPQGHYGGNPGGTCFLQNCKLRLKIFNINSHPFLPQMHILPICHMAPDFWITLCINMYSTYCTSFEISTYFDYKFLLFHFWPNIYIVLHGQKLVLCVPNGVS